MNLAWSQHVLHYNASSLRLEKLAYAQKNEIYISEQQIESVRSFNKKALLDSKRCSFVFQPSHSVALFHCPKKLDTWIRDE
jgi:hypothetical protein